MLPAHETRIPAKDVRSLCWEGDTLVDWVAGGNRFYLDGRVEPRHVNYAFTFDAAAVSPNGEYAAIYARLGTKALILRHGEVVREINRSFYHANAYEYPIALLSLKDGRQVLAHCPENYARLELDDLATGHRLTSSDSRNPSDYFFSRLAVNSNASFLVSAGWHWQPVDHVKVFDMEQALREPSHLDSQGLPLDTWAENATACFIGNHRLAVSLADDAAQYDVDQNTVPADGAEEAHRSPLRELRLFNLEHARLLKTLHTPAPLGALMAVGEDHVIGFYDYPKLIDLRSGAIVESWPSIKTGTEMNSIAWHRPPDPPRAFDPPNRRFAVAAESEIVVLQFGPEQSW